MKKIVTIFLMGFFSCCVLGVFAEEYQSLSRERQLELIVDAKLAASAYGDYEIEQGYRVATAYEFKKYIGVIYDLVYDNGLFRSHETDLDGRLLINISDGSFVLAFAGTDKPKDVVVDAEQATGDLPHQYVLAANVLLRLLQNTAQSIKIKVVGHSLGGGTATYATLFNQSTRVITTTFNTAGLLSTASLPALEGNPAIVKSITHVCTELDPVSKYGKIWGTVYTIINDNLASELFPVVSEESKSSALNTTVTIFDTIGNSVSIASKFIAESVKAHSINTVIKEMEINLNPAPAQSFHARDNEESSPAQIEGPNYATNSYYKYLMELKESHWLDPGEGPDVYEKFFSMPDCTEEQVYYVKMKLLKVYHYHDYWYKEIALFKELIISPLTTDLKRHDLLINLSKLYRFMNDEKESVACLVQTLKGKELTPQQRADILLMLGENLWKGDGWHFIPSEKEYLVAKNCCFEVFGMKKATAKQRIAAVKKFIEIAYEMKKYSEIIAFSEKYLYPMNENHTNADVWGFIKDYEGKAYMALEDFPAAVAVYEALYRHKYKLADTCMSLGQAYYCNKNYEYALAMYNKALVELGLALPFAYIGKYA